LTASPAAFVQGDSEGRPVPVSFDFGQLDAPVAVPRAGSGASAEQLAHVVEAARAEAYEAGRRDGAAEAEVAVSAAVQALSGAAAALVAEREALADATERAAVELALRIAEKVVQASVANDPERVVDAVRGALRLLLDRERFTVLVNPDDLDVVREGLASVVAELGGVEHYEVQAERRVTRGGAVVRTVEGEVDATLEAKLQRAREVLEDERASR
jgi:flagellar assembly protein FliH